MKHRCDNCGQECSATRPDSTVQAGEAHKGKMLWQPFEWGVDCRCGLKRLAANGTKAAV